MSVGFMADVKDIRSDDPYVVREAALRLGRLGDSTHVNALISALDPGGYAQFRQRPQDNPARGTFGGYRDKVIGIAEALWMLGDPVGLHAAAQALETTIRDGYVQSSLPAEAFSPERQLLARINAGSPYVESWRDDSDFAWLKATDQASVARWAVDPSGLHQLRYWSGETWTEHVSDDGRQSVDLVGESVASGSADLATPDVPTFVIDVSNVVLWRSGPAAQAHLGDFDLVVAELTRRWPGCAIRAISDASLRHRLAESEPTESVRYESLLSSGRIVQAPPRTKADTFVIQEADHLGGFMVTNDLYNKDGEADLASTTVVEGRFVRFHFADNAVFFDARGEIRPLPSRGAVQSSDLSRSTGSLGSPSPSVPPAPPRRAGLDGLGDVLSVGVDRILHDYRRSLQNVRCANCGNYMLVWDDTRRRNKAAFTVTIAMILLFSCAFAAGRDQNTLGTMFPCLVFSALLAVASAAFGIARWKPAGAFCMRCHRHYESDEVDQLLGG